jgi:hypothetical protein
VHGATAADDQQHDPLPYGFSQAGVNYSMPSPSDIAYDRHKIDNPQNARNHPNGQVLEQEKWTDRVKEPKETWRQEIERNRQEGGSGQNEQAEGRVLPEEQREKQQERDRGGRCR